MIFFAVFIISLLATLILIIGGVRRRHYYNCISILALVDIVSFIIVLFLSCYGLDVYISLLADKTEITTMQQNITRIQNAYYKSEDTGNTLIKGSIENMQQSTNLSEYISKYITLKAKYNQKLTIELYWYNSIIGKVFGASLIIDKRIKELEIMGE